MTCPLCSRPTDSKHNPFCSKRCADVDLAKWFTGSYAVAGEDTLQENSEEPDEA